MHHRLCVAPMLDWTDKHCRYFHRLLSPNAYLYTEMVTTGAILFGQTASHLQFNLQEKPLALQLGGSDPKSLAQSAYLAEMHGFDEINLNCGCPSARVQKGAFGACLMAEPKLVVACWEAMRKSCSLPITIKHRIGIDNQDNYSFVYHFVNELFQAGCQTFIVHARKAILKGLSPKENRQIPLLNYDFVYQLKNDFPDCKIIINGGICTLSDVSQHLKYVDGVMIGREAYHNPVILFDLDQTLFSGKPGNKLNALSASSVLQNGQANNLDNVINEYRQYMLDALNRGENLSVLIRPLLGWRRGQKNARRFRHVLSNSKRLSLNDISVVDEAFDCF